MAFPTAVNSQITDAVSEKQPKSSTPARRAKTTANKVKARAGASTGKSATRKTAKKTSKKK